MHSVSPLPVQGPMACILPRSPCYDPWYDPELERLRALERRAQIEAEKAAIRERLRRMGYPAGQVYPSPYVPLPSPYVQIPPPGWVTLTGRTPNPPLTVEEIIRLVPKA